MEKTELVNEVYYPLLFNEDRYLVLIGGAGCFCPDQLIETDSGPVKISDIKEGDRVLSYNHDEKQNEFRLVTFVHIFSNHPDRVIKIKMKDGTVIKVTENHRFYVGGSYLKIKDILLNLQNERMEKNKEIPSL